MYIINMHSFEKKLNVWHVQEQLQEHLYQVAIQKQLDLSLKALRDQHLNQLPISQREIKMSTRSSDNPESIGLGTPSRSDVRPKGAPSIRVKNKKRVKCTIL